MRKVVYSLMALAAATVSLPATAATVLPSLATASSAYPGFEASYAIDTGVNAANTDWASNGGGAGSFLELTLPGVSTLSAVDVTDRVTSGGGNGAFYGGLYDFTTSFTIQAFTNASFTTASSSLYSFTKLAPSSTTSPSDFLFVGSLPDISAQYIKYTVVAANGVNPGVSNIEFTSVPEPATWALMLAGFGLIGFGMRQRQTRIRFAV